MHLKHESNMQACEKVRQLAGASLLVLTGASGAGKTTLVRALQSRHPTLCECLFFDTVGVPSIEDMGCQYGSGEAWQRAMTLQWFERIAPLLHSGTPVLFEGQMRIAFIRDAVAAAGIARHRILLVDCNDATRTARLSKDRGQPELANDQMMNWARYLRKETQTNGCEILDTSHLSMEECLQRLVALLTGSNMNP